MVEVGFHNGDFACDLGMSKNLASSVDRVARCLVFDQTVRFFGDLSGQKMRRNWTGHCPVFRSLLVHCSDDRNLLNLQNCMLGLTNSELL